MNPDYDVVDRLRQRIVAGLHLGHLRSGSRLPSVREVKRETGVDHRVVAAAYRELAREGLVEIRPRSGMYVADQGRLNEELFAETGRWLTDVLTAGWVRRWSVPELPGLVHRCTRRRTLRCAVVESNEDQTTGLVTELANDFGLDTFGVRPPKVNAMRAAVETLEAELAPADLVVTTSFHATLVERAVAAVKRPVIVAHLNASLVEAVEAALRGGGATFVVADPRFGERLHAMFDGYGDRLRVVLAGDRAAVDRLGSDAKVFLTRAARQRIGERPLRLAFPHSPSISRESAHELCAWIVRLNTIGGPAERGSG